MVYPRCTQETNAASNRIVPVSPNLAPAGVSRGRVVLAFECLRGWDGETDLSGRPVRAGIDLLPPSKLGNKGSDKAVAQPGRPVLRPSHRPMLTFQYHCRSPPDSGRR